MADLTPAQQAEITRQLQERRRLLRSFVFVGVAGLVLLAFIGPPALVLLAYSVGLAVLTAALANHHRKVVAAVESHGWRRE